MKIVRKGDKITVSDEHGNPMTPAATIKGYKGDYNSRIQMFLYMMNRDFNFENQIYQDNFDHTIKQHLKMAQANPNNLSDLEKNIKSELRGSKKVMLNLSTGRIAALQANQYTMDALIQSRDMILDRMGALLEV